MNSINRIRNDLKCNVSIVETGPDFSQVFNAVQEAMRLVNWKQYISPGADIALKPNLGWDKLIPGAISAPWVVEAVILIIRNYVGDIFLVESDQVVVNVEDAFHLTGLDAVCQRQNIRWVNLSKGEFVRVKNPENLVLRDIMLPEILTRTELITLPLLKTHNKTTITGAIKNQWGCLDTLRHNYHLVLSEALVDITRLTKPKFCIMDGTIALEGNGPKSGSPRVMNTVLASCNPVNLDAVAASLMGFDPYQISHLKLCAEHGLGNLDGFQILGDIEKLQQDFIPARHNPVSWLELLLRQSFFAWLVFQTPLFKMMTWGARRYYDLWDWWVGRHLRRRLFAESDYAKQWET
jgi:uncharacterized protein (DUF362 family)